MTFTDILNSGSLDDIANWLDSQASDDRLKAIQSLNKKQQRELFDKCRETEPLTLEYFCAEPNVEVIHDGKNSLPAFTTFQKRFVRLDDERVVGYNHASTMGFIGPGYFVLKETSNLSEVLQSHGSVVVDYYEVLDKTTPIPSTWPKIKGNHQGPQMFVYNKMHDFMRRVSSHVSIGSAFKKGKSIDSYFLLCRRSS